MKGTPMPKDEAEPAPAEETKSETAPETDTGKTQESKQSRGEARKAQLGQEIQDLLRQRAALRGEIEAAGKGTQADKTAEPAAAKPEDGKPTPPDPKTWTGTWEELEAAKLKYVEDLIAWQAGKGQRDKTAETKQAELTEAQKGYKERAEKALAEDPEYADAQDVIGRFVTARGVSDLVLESEVGPGIVMHLYKLPQAEQQRVANLSPLALSREIGRIEQQLKAGAPAKTDAAAPGEKSTSQPKKTSAAAKPATELSGQHAASTVDEAEEALANGDTGRYIEIMNAREVKKKR